MAQQRSQRDTRDLDPTLRWLIIDDFRPGIYSQANFALTAPQATPASTIQKGIGVAQEAGTYGCIAIPGGGLAPLPGIKKSVNAPASLSGLWHTNGAFIIPQVNSADEIVYGLEQLAGANREFYLESYQDFNGVTTQIEHMGPSTKLTGTGISPLTGGMTRVNTSTPSSAGNPCLAIAYEWNVSSPQSFNWLYPNPTTPGSFTPLAMSNAVNADAVCWNNRIIFLTIINYEWTASSTSLNTNENINYTDPPNSATISLQNTVLSQENPFGYGAWGSITNGELVLIKYYGGGVVVSGDIVNPVITRLGAIPGTNGALGLGASTPSGFFYCSNDNGLWNWDGGNTAQKVSVNLRDNFWQTAGPLGAGGIQWTVSAIGELVLVSNDWIYDTVTGGWWRLINPQGTQESTLFFLPTGDGSGFWAIPDTISYASGTPVIAREYSYSTPGNVYSWKSYPIPASINRFVTTREVVLRVQGNGSIVITCEGTGGSSNSTLPATVNVNSSQPVLVRTDVGGNGHDVTVQVVSTGASGGPAPIIHSIAVAYRQEQLVNAT